MKLLTKKSSVSKTVPPLDLEFRVKAQGISSATMTFSTSRMDGIAWKITGPVSPLLKGMINQWMESYIKGIQPQEPLPVLLDHLPPYTKRVLTLLRDVPFGVTLTYKQLAEITGNPHGARAVGNACSNNPFLLIIPCHRVLAAKGIGGFSSGLEIKRALLSFEGR